MDSAGQKKMQTAQACHAIFRIAVLKRIYCACV